MRSKGGVSPIDEVVRQHRFIEGWLRGESDAVWVTFDAALAPEFSMVVPDGTVVERAALMDQFHAAHGAVPGIRIDIREAVLLDGVSELAVVRYEEWQQSPEGANGRVATAVFSRAPSAPIGWSWRCLHETWLVAPA